MEAQAHELAIALPAVAHDADARLADLAGDEPPDRQLASCNSNTRPRALLKDSAMMRSISA